MDDIKIILEEYINEELIQVIFSNAKDKTKISKLKVRPILLKEKVYFQFTSYIGVQVFHHNYELEMAKKELLLHIKENFGQMELQSQKKTVILLISKKGKITIKKKKNNEINKINTFEHNRKKRYILEEGIPIDFLVKLGVQNKEGKIIKSMYDKYRQINRYLEFVEDIIKYLPKQKVIKIIDFGCGKSYLTFSLYYYLHELLGYDVEIVGLDLKESVIQLCNDLAEEFQYKHLKFEKGDISTYQGQKEVDMVVSLHACDTATDLALHKAIMWNTKVILAVPCCQHELNKQLQYEPMEPFLQYGIIKERMASLMTDAIRANLLVQQGYSTQILEFIDLEHTPKNLLIRAVKVEEKKSIQSTISKEDMDELFKEMNVTPMLQELLNNQKMKQR